VSTKKERKSWWAEGREKLIDCTWLKTLGWQGKGKGEKPGSIRGRGGTIFIGGKKKRKQGRRGGDSDGPLVKLQTPRGGYKGIRKLGRVGSEINVKKGDWVANGVGLGGEQELSPGGKAVLNGKARTRKISLDSSQPDGADGRKMSRGGGGSPLCRSTSLPPLGNRQERNATEKLLAGREKRWCEGNFRGRLTRDEGRTIRGEK